MNKETKKKNNYNTEILNRIKDKYGLSLGYIRMSLSGDRTSEMSDVIIKEYKAMDNALTTLLKKL